MIDEELLKKIVEIINKSRPDEGWEDEDRDLYFLYRGQQEACDEIEAAIKRLT